MKANELRIGNLFQDKKGTRLTSFGCTPDDDTDKFNVWYGNELGFYLPEKEIEGIPLTEERLIKFGFEKVEFDGITTYGNKIFYIEKEYKGNFYIVLQGKKIALTYVHQLQNLYFVLTGEELEIK